jgi:hypothetical protein
LGRRAKEVHSVTRRTTTTTTTTAPGRCTLIFHWCRSLHNTALHVLPVC